MSKSKKKRYTVEQLRTTDLSTLSYGELRKAYTAYRDTMKKRIERLKVGTPAQQRHVKPFLRGGNKEILTLTQLDWMGQTSYRNLLFNVKELQILEQRALMSIEGWRRVEKQIIASLHEAKYENINQKNLRLYGTFMEIMREEYKNKVFPSEQLAEAFNTAAEEVATLTEKDLESLLSAFSVKGEGVDLFA